METNNKITRRWILLPGMGASSAMYNALRHHLHFRIDFINWPLYRGEKSYEEVARRVIEGYNMDERDIVGGSSLGGMVALEIAKRTNAKAAILIGSAIHSGEVQTMLALLSLLAALTPISVVQTLAGKQKSTVSGMFAAADPEFIRAMCSYLPSWHGYTEAPTKVYRIHGKRDHVIPCPSSDCDVINDAGHLLVMIHPGEVAAFLDKVQLKIGG